MTAGPGIDEVVLTAAGLDGADRETYLDQIAAVDPALVEVARRRLSAAENRTDTFLDAPAAVRLGGVDSDAAEEGDGPALEAALPSGERYRLGRELGQGGMGRVVEAYDQQLDRTVALKFLTHEDPEILHLFLREARAQARVQHDHVLPVYDSGELDGRPYIAMHRASDGTLGDVEENLSLEHKVRLLAQAARGLHAAHGKGLLHRDVKPSNILVDRTNDGEPRALVTDFGLAAELDDAAGLAGGAVAGTPQYIAPERLSLLVGSERTPLVGSEPTPLVGSLPTPLVGSEPTLVDRRSDVYSLGVTIYRLLAGELPSEGGQTIEVLRRTVDRDLPPPRQIRPGLPAELEAIILRCVARDPEDRYSSARAVAEDLERYLDGEVVEAYAAGMAYRLTRFVLRNKLLATTAALAAVALVISSVAVAIFALRADAARERAELRQGQAEELIRFTVVDLQDKLASLGRLDILADASSAAEKYFAAVPEAELSEAELLRRSRMLYQIGDVRIRAGDLAGAASPMGESLALAQQLVELNPNDGERLFELGQAHFWVGFVAWEQGDLEAARVPFEDYLEISRRLVALDESNLEWRQELSYAHSNLGSLLEAEGDLEGALEQFLATLAIDRRLVAADPENGEARSELAATHNTIGVVLQRLGRLNDAKDHLQADLEMRRDLVEATPADLRARDRLGTSHGHLGLHLSMRGDWTAADEHLRRQQEIFSELVTHDPANTGWQFNLAWSQLGLGRGALARGDFESARTIWRPACQTIDSLILRDATAHKLRRTQAICRYHQALVQMPLDISAARERALGAVETLEELIAVLPTDRQVHRWLSQSYLLLGNLEDSRSAGTAAFERAEDLIAPFARGQRDGTVLAPWAVALSCLGRLNEAESVRETLDGLGYSEPGLDGLCTSETNRSELALSR